MTPLITGIVPDDSGKIITAEREVWRINIFQSYFTNVILEIANSFLDFFCRICHRNHVSESALINCLYSHGGASVDYYLDYVLEDLK